MKSGGHGKHVSEEGLGLTHCKTWCPDPDLHTLTWTTALNDLHLYDWSAPSDLTPLPFKHAVITWNNTNSGSKPQTSLWARSACLPPAELHRPRLTSQCAPGVTSLWPPHVSCMCPTSCITISFVWFRQFNCCKPGYWLVFTGVDNHFVYMTPETIIKLLPQSDSNWTTEAHVSELVQLITALFIFNQNTCVGHNACAHAPKTLCSSIFLLWELLVCCWTPFLYHVT